jgi:uncharacterized Zn finger protein
VPSNRGPTTLGTRYARTCWRISLALLTPTTGTRIYLSEGLIDDAVRSVGDRFGYGAAHDETLLRLAAIAHTSHPDWVIRVAMSQAASIMDGNRAGHYELAVQWLEKAALAYEVLGREDDWRACLDELIERHRRTYKLRPLLEGLRGA